MSRNKIIWYNPGLRALSRQLRANSTKTEIILWKNIKGIVLGHKFHRQVPINEFMVDFYCHELFLAIEIDGCTHYYNYEKDKMRQDRLESLGIKVLRFNDEDIKRHLNDVLRIIQSVIEEIERTSP